MMSNHLPRKTNVSTVLVTGAGGKTGHNVIQALLNKGFAIRALLFNNAEGTRLDQKVDKVYGDMTHQDDLERAMQGVDAVYHICPNMHPDEVKIGQLAIQAARDNGLQHFVFHSVLHPQVREMPHHWNKLGVEILLFKSGLNYTILQPTAYCQNLLQYKKSIIEQGIYAVPYNGATRIGMVDLQDVSEAAATVMGRAEYFGGTYELATDEVFTQQELTILIGQVLRREVLFSEINRKEWSVIMLKSGMNEYACRTLIRMFKYYEKHGFHGNGRVLSQILGHAPASMECFIRNHF
jgi:NAD(P)H dehydrogenase (quinone)